MTNTLLRIDAGSEKAVCTTYISSKLTLWSNEFIHYTGQHPLRKAVLKTKLNLAYGYKLEKISEFAFYISRKIAHIR